MLEPDTRVDERERLRREAAGAFAHDLRSPLASLHMALDLAARESAGGQLVLDEDLAGLMREALGGLERLVDDFHLATRLERGILAPEAGPADLSTVVAEATALLGGAPDLQGTVPPDVHGPWDATWLTRSLTAFARTADKLGGGSRLVDLRCAAAGRGIEIELASGLPARACEPLAADAGYEFFFACHCVEAMGGAVEAARARGYASIRLRLPL